MDEQDSGVLATEQSRRRETLQLSLSDEFKPYHPLRGPIKKARGADDLMTRHKCTFFSRVQKRGQMKANGDFRCECGAVFKREPQRVALTNLTIR